jgi:hypothetical protein
VELEPFAVRPAEDDPAGGQPPVDAVPPERLRDGSETVTRERGLFEALVRRQGDHPSLERREEPAGGGKGARERPDELLVPFEAGAADARSEAAPHVGQYARGEPRPDPHRPGAPAHREDVLECVLGLPRGRGRTERAEVDAPIVDRGGAHDLQPRPGFGGIELEVRVAPPTLPVAVEPRLVAGDQPGFQDERLRLAAGGRDAAHAGDHIEQVLHLLALVAVEVRAHPSSEVDGLPDVQDLPVATSELVDAGRPGEIVGQPDLPEVGPSSGRARLSEIPQGGDPQPLTELQETGEHLRGRLGVRERAVDRHRSGTEVPREGP